MHVLAPGLTSRAMSWCLSKRITICSIWMSAIWSMCSRWRRLKTTVSSMRFINSGLRFFRTTSMMDSLTDDSLPFRWLGNSDLICVPMFEVMTTITFEKSTWRPWESVNLPSSKSCNNRFHTSGSAFSNSSSRITWNGRLRMASVSTPPFSCPTYPGGDLINRETVCFPPNSDMSIRVIAFWSSKRNSASALHSSVFPTPDGPAQRKLPRVRSRACNPVRDNRTQFNTAVNAWSWPTTRLRSSSSMSSNFLNSFPVIFDTGIPVARATIVAMALASTASAGNRLFLMLGALSRSLSSSLSRSSSSCCRSGIVECKSSPAFLKSPLDRASSISRCNFANFSFSCFTRLRELRSSCHTVVSFCTRSSNSLTSDSTDSRRLIESLSSSPRSALASIRFVMRSRSTFHKTSGLDSCSSRSLLHASSTKSMDLSGWNRSLMYRSLISAAATSASSLMRIPAWCSS
mmetsp:Transcript_34564/g.72401  ORF Transcript_34564/g.72401 Transcript_34564/m.72401 type:complete len:460 (-) Transcript_34564:1111-2490(-)